VAKLGRNTVRNSGPLASMTTVGWYSAGLGVNLRHSKEAFRSMKSYSLPFLCWDF
jgi:hypothetical protein